MAPPRLSETGSVKSNSDLTEPLLSINCCLTNETLDQARIQYFALLENEVSSSRARDGALDRKIHDIEARRARAMQTLESEMVSFERELSDKISKLKSSQENHAGEFLNAEEAHRRVNEVAAQQFSAVDAKLDALQRNLKLCKERISKVEASSESGIQQSAGVVQEMETKVSNFAGRLRKNQEDTKQELNTIKEDIEKIRRNEIRKSKFKSLVEDMTASRVQIRETEAVLRELKRSAAEERDETCRLVAQQQEKLRLLEKSQEKEFEDTRDHLDELQAKTHEFQLFLDEQYERFGSFELSTQVIHDALKSLQERLADQTGQFKEMQADTMSTAGRLDSLDKKIDNLDQRLDEIARGQLDVLRKEMDAKFAVQRSEYQNDVAGLIQALEEQQETIQQQSGTISSLSSQLDRQQNNLLNFKSTIRNHSDIINMQSRGLEDNEFRLKNQGRELRGQIEIIEHFKKTLPAFMKDLRKVDDKIEDFIDDQAIKEKKLHCMLQKQSCRCETSLRSRDVHRRSKFARSGRYGRLQPGQRKLRFVPRLRK